MSKQPLKNRKIVKDAVPSKFLADERPVRIYVPPVDHSLFKDSQGTNSTSMQTSTSTQSSTTMHILYVQDGQDAFMYGRLATIAHMLIQDKVIEPVIVVGVDVLPRERTAEYHPDGEMNEAYVRFFAEDLVPYVVRTYASETDASETGISGMF